MSRIFEISLQDDHLQIITNVHLHLTFITSINTFASNHLEPLTTWCTCLWERCQVAKSLNFFLDTIPWIVITTWTGIEYSISSFVGFVRWMFNGPRNFPRGLSRMWSILPQPKPMVPITPTGQPQLRRIVAPGTQRSTNAASGWKECSSV